MQKSQGRGFVEEDKLGVLHLKSHPHTNRNLTASKKGTKGSVVVVLFVDFKISKEQPYILQLENGNSSRWSYSSIG